MDKNNVAKIIHATHGVAAAGAVRKLMSDDEIRNLCHVDAEHISYDCKIRQKKAIAHQQQRIKLTRRKK
tara:strand:+ start:585 stop:791 length:207 start_codon:yes stop_codon:yes gene_type:complete